MSQPQKKEPAKSKHKSNRPRNQMYEVTGTIAKLKNKKCPRCGAVMAFHRQPTERWVCGACSFTDYPART